jgi:deoxyribose-phosphate aldolase
MKYSYEDVAKMIDHSLLNPTLTPEDLEAGCRLAIVYNTASVCILPFAVTGAASLLSGTDVAVGTTVGFPHGGNTTTAKIVEAEQAIQDGAIELDMVINISLALSGRIDEVEKEVETLASLAHRGGARLKVIFENCYLGDETIVALCKACGRAGVDWVKTSTGYGDGGATDEDLKLMRKYSPENVQIKAAGGVRTLDRLLEVRKLGCTRVGATRTASILEDARKRLGLEPIVGGINTDGESGDY